MNRTVPTTTSDAVLAALARKHEKDVFIPECKNGSTWSGSAKRLDAWAMPRSWLVDGPRETYGYEIKVSRNDWLKDCKWHEYRANCHYLFLVCPWGLVQPGEIGDGAGLMWMTQSGSRLVTKKKAPRNTNPDLLPVMTYILMSRSRICPSTYGQTGPMSKERWSALLNEEDEDKKFGQLVARNIGTTLAHQKAKIEMLVKDMDSFKMLIDGQLDRLKRAGIVTDTDGSMYQTSRQIVSQTNRLLGMLPDGLQKDLTQAVDALNRALCAVRNVQQAAG